jgi:hypothetical protein
VFATRSGHVVGFVSLPAWTTSDLCSDASITFRPPLSRALAPTPTRLPCGGLSPSPPPRLHRSPPTASPRPRSAPLNPGSWPHLQPIANPIFDPTTRTHPPLIQRRQCRLSRPLSPRLPRTLSRSLVPLRLLPLSPPPRPSSQTPTVASAPTLRPATPLRATLRLRSRSTSRRARLPTDSWMRMQRLKWLVCRIQMVAVGSRALRT